MGQEFYTDSDDLRFERVFFAIERRHQDLPAGLTENLEPLAILLIRRAQTKGPYELLGRDVPPSDSWKKYESERVMQVAAENLRVMQNQKQPTAPTYPVPAATDPQTPPVLNMARGPLPINHLIDPRLLYASPGQFTAPELSGSLTLTELQYYYHRNKDIEASIALKLAPLHNQQQRYEAQNSVHGSQVMQQGYQQDRISPVRQEHHVPDPASPQPYTSSYVRYLGQQRSAIPNQLPSQAPVSTPQMYDPAQPTQRLFQQSCYLQPPGHQSQNIQHRPVPVAPRFLPPQPVPLSTYYDITHHGLKALTKPAGISKSIPKAPNISGLPDFSDPAQRAISMAAFKKLSREEKIAKFLELERAEKVLNPNATTRVQKFFIKAAAEQAAAAKATAGGKQRTKQSKVIAKKMNMSPDIQAITVPTPGYQIHPGAYMTAPGAGGFASHPRYSNITSSFPSPQFHGSLMAPTPASKRDEKRDEIAKDV
ncbi:hypothetical protein G6011_03051 [Alternaria panax]|uniref:Uncharacterized protein n=1 Tax=Alternaria panax TaxID=48097 RepID=A0AAD4IE06_9PLEO|nr:hypothetical protein G6011_03051 [Alternaria panax]